MDLFHVPLIVLIIYVKPFFTVQKIVNGRFYKGYDHLASFLQSLSISFTPIIPSSLIYSFIAWHVECNSVKVTRENKMIDFLILIFKWFIYIDLGIIGLYVLIMSLPTNPKNKGQSK